MAIFAPHGNIIQSLENKDPQCTTGKCVGAVEINGECYGASGSIKEFPYSSFIMFINRTDTAIGLTMRKKYTSGPAVGQCTTRVAFVPACGSSNTFIPYRADICMIWEQIGDSELPKYLKGCDVCTDNVVSFSNLTFNPWPEGMPIDIKNSLTEVLNKTYSIELEGDEDYASGSLILDPIEVSSYVLPLPPIGVPVPGNQCNGDTWTTTIGTYVDTVNNSMGASISIEGNCTIFGSKTVFSASVTESDLDSNFSSVNKTPSIGGWITYYDNYYPGYPPLEGYIDFSGALINLSTSIDKNF